MSTATTRGVRIDVRARFLPDQSDPRAGVWAHAYEVTITNASERTVQLISRHWIIRNEHGVEEHVRGPGVVGEQPRLAPGQRFVYTSGCPLDTAVGSMEGTFQMVDDTGARFDAEIARFTLAEPYVFN
ncbi:MAG: Co2+/Mg2+ efflux protein ApaG [Deltaproteobacteria bacterium]|nr:Co2+/Mg2+ efflux protein ApaG [Deltaproteobacteria bacterium]